MCVSCSQLVLQPYAQAAQFPAASPPIYPRKYIYIYMYIRAYVHKQHSYMHTYMYISKYIHACDLSDIIPPKNGEIAVLLTTNGLMCSKYVSLKRNEAFDNSKWYNMLLTFKL